MNRCRVFHQSCIAEMSQAMSAFFVIDRAGTPCQLSGLYAFYVWMVMKPMHTLYPWYKSNKFEPWRHLKSRRHLYFKKTNKFDEI